MEVNNKRGLWQTFAHGLKGTALVAAMIAMGLIGTPVQAETVDKAPCMQDAAGFNLVCSANDIQLSEVAEEDIEILDPCLYPGDTTTFRATFTTVLTAKERHDLGIYFAIDGDVNGDGALTGECSVSSLEYKPEPWLDLDGISDPYVGENKASGRQDTCGDIDADHNPLRPVITITTTCVDDDGNGFLDLPYCTSWRQSGANELCTGPLAEELLAGRFSSGVTPGAPSKCNCNPGFNVPVPVPPARLNVTKSVTPVSVPEPGGSVVYSVFVNNMGVDPNNQVTLDSLIDDIYGDITAVSGSITATDCVVPQTLISGAAPYSCNFTVAVVGNAGLTIPDTVTASGTDGRGNTITGSDDANITITGVSPSIDVSKTASPVEVLEPGADVSFTVRIDNTSVSSDPVTINSLVDTIHGDLNGKGNCAVPITIQPGEFYTCTFTAFVGGAPGTSETDIVTATGTDDEGVAVSGSDSAVVAINDVPSSISLVKTAPFERIDEPGGNVEYTFTVTNDSSVDTVTINTFIDVVDDTTTDLNGEGNCSVGFSLAPHESYACTATFFVGGDVGESVTNTSTASGLDDDGVEVSASDTYTINFDDVPPEACVEKTAESVIVNYRVVVTNSCCAESATIDSLIDAPYGDITDAGNVKIIETNCSVPITLSKSGEDGDSYTCNFSAEAKSSPAVDTVTVQVSDNDGGSVSCSDSASVIFK